MARLVIEAGYVEREYWRDLWRYRELFYVLAWRDISVRYKQTVVGVAWALIQPLAGMIIFTFVFGKLAKMPSLGVPYPLLVLTGFLPWQLFSTSLAATSQSLIGNANLISKVYFPRLVIPTSTVVTAFIDFLISFALMIAVMGWYQFLPPWQIIFLPAFIVLAFIAVLGPGLLITALNVKYRDFRYIIPFLIQFGVYISPVGFASGVITDPVKRLFYSLNPAVGVIDGFRWCLLGGANSLDLPGLAASVTVNLLLLWAGLAYFRRTERGFADVI